MGLQETACACMELIQLARHMLHWGALCNFVVWGETEPT
jgi:hypothetical protein